MAAPQRVEFRAFDGTVLRGDFYATNKPKAPIIVMTQGLTLLKEHYIPTFAKRFVEAGYAALIYDHRGWGSSEGPANVVDPLQQAEDYHDAVIYAGSLPGIDSERVCIWGIGHSGGASMIAAADDPNIKAVILVMPFLSGKDNAATFPPGALAKAWDYRKSKLMAPASAEKAYIQIWDNSEEEANGERGSILLHGPVPYKFISGARKLSDAAGTLWMNRMTAQSLHYIARSEPKDYLPRITPPLLHLAAVEDPLSGPLEGQKKAFETAKEPKEFVVLDDHHIENYFKNFEQTVKAMLDFLRKYV